jgi:hypothetical protein
MKKGEDTRSSSHGGPSPKRRPAIHHPAALDELLGPSPPRPKILGTKPPVDPSTLGPPENSDARKWLEQNRVALIVPAGWKYMGIVEEGRRLSFNSTGKKDGLDLDVHCWSIPDDVPVERLIEGHKDAAAFAMNLGLVTDWAITKQGEVDGVLQLTWGPETKEQLAETTDEQLYLATEGTGRRTLSWRGAQPWHDGNRLVIVKMSAEVADFPEQLGLFETMLKHVRVD